MDLKKKGNGSLFLLLVNYDAMALMRTMPNAVVGIDELHANYWPNTILVQCLPLPVVSLLFLV
jgi:hypothetical protein